MPTRVLLTIDTELTWRHHRGGGCWRANFERSYEAAGVGVPYQLEVLAEHKLKACFFVDPMPALLFGIEPIAAMVKPIIAAGQEVQLHLHPFWANLADGDHVGTDFELASYDAERQVELVGIARDLLMQAGAPAPVAFRAGSYAANADTIPALAAHGLRYDSSHDRGHHPRSSFLPLPPGQVAPTQSRVKLRQSPLPASHHPARQFDQTVGRLETRPRIRSERSVFVAAAIAEDQ